MTRLLLALTLLAPFAACDSVSSTIVPTDEMGMQGRATVSADGELELLVTLTTDNEALLEVTYINLEAGDALFATHGPATTQMSEEYVVGLNLYQYRARMDGAAASELVVDLRRTTDDDAPSSRVIVPTPFAIDSPPSEHPRGSPLDLSWDAPNEVDTTAVFVRGDCVRGSETRVDFDPGSATIPASAFDVPPDSTIDPSAPCRVSVDVRRIADGEVDRAYGRGGRIEAIQNSAIELDIVLAP